MHSIRVHSKTLEAAEKQSTQQAANHAQIYAVAVAVAVPLPTASHMPTRSSVDANGVEGASRRWEECAAARIFYGGCRVLGLDGC